MDDVGGMDEHPNATAYRRTADAFRAGDRETLAVLIDEDVVWHIPGSGPLAGDIDGREALFRFFDRLRDVTEGTFTIGEHDVLGSDEHVVALSYMSAVREGTLVSVDVVSVFHFRDGRQQERWLHPSDMVAWDRVLGGPM
jgi:ketosteroid isomerase-like protein